MKHLHGDGDIFGIRSICELIFFVLYVTFVKYEVREIKIKGVTKIDLFTFKILRNCIQLMENDDNLKSVSHQGVQRRTAKGQLVNNRRGKKVEG